MKKLVFIFLILLNSVLVLGQQVNSPDPKTFIQGTVSQDASGFSLSGFNSTVTLLCAIGLPQAPTGTTFSLTTVSGLTPASGYTMNGNKTRLAFTGTMANINAALATLKINTTATAGAINISVSATVNPTGYFYNPTNGHFYRPISTGATYTNARTLSSQQTFKGQQGYLVTITSADEDAFIFANVPQASIWFALTDEAVEGQWRIDAGPEAGTLIKTANGQLNGNVVGQYNNWAGGEPNNSGNEDYAVTKWGGGNQWNDLPNNFSCAYVVEFGTWTNPDDQTFTEFYSNSVTHSNGETLRLQFTFDFGNNIDETKFKTKMFTYTDYVSGPYNEAVTGTTYTSLNGLGKTDKTNDIDLVKINSGQKATISTGQAEFSYVNISNNTTTLYIDLSRFGGVDPSTISNVSILDAYNGPVTYQQTSTYWAHYIVPSALTKITNGTSSFNSSIRNAGNNNWAFMSNISFSQNQIFKNHAILFQSYNSSELQTLLSQIVTISDVYLAFKEFSDRGIFGNSNGQYFQSGIQFQNADVNHDNVFDETDCFKLLKYLQGTENLWESAALPYVMKIVPKSTYDDINKNNWNTFGAYEFLRSKYPITLNDGVLNSHVLNVTWKGDVNLSHSPAQSASGSIANQSLSFSSVAMQNVVNSESPTAYIVSQISGDVLDVIIKFNSKSNPIVGTQFQINYDNTRIKYVSTDFKIKGSPSNFDANRGSFINLGSLVTSGELLDPLAEYRLTFKLKTNLSNSLGLISIASNEAVNQTGQSIKIRIE